MSNEIEALILARAGAMAEHDGGVVSRVYIVGAANQLQTELLHARDALLLPPAPAPLAEPQEEQGGEPRPEAQAADPAAEPEEQAAEPEEEDPLPAAEEAAAAEGKAPKA